MHAKKYSYHRSPVKEVASSWEKTQGLIVTTCLVILVAFVFFSGVMYGRHLERTQRIDLQLAQVLAAQKALLPAADYTFAEVLSKPEETAIEPHYTHGQLKGSAAIAPIPTFDDPLRRPQEQPYIQRGYDEEDYDPVDRNQDDDMESDPTTEDFADPYKDQGYDQGYAQKEQGFHRQGIHRVAPADMTEPEDDLVPHEDADPNPVAIEASMKPTADGAYAIQMGAFRKRDEAVRLIQQLSNKGYEAYLGPTHYGSQGRWFRVWMGNYRQKSQAKDLLKSFQSTPYASSFIVTLKNSET